MLGCWWHGNRRNASHCDSALIATVDPPHSPSAIRAALDCGDGTDTTATIARVMKILSRTTVSRDHTPGAGTCRCGSRADLGLTYDALRPGEPLCLRETLAAHGFAADHVKIWQTVGKLRRRHGLVMSGKPREPGESRQAGYTVTTWGYVSRRRLRDSLARWERNPQLALFDRLREAKRVRSTVKS